MQGSMEFNKLHRASCEDCDPRRHWTAMTVRRRGQKIWFASMREAVDWLLDDRPGKYSK